ncbi:hypothetical protein LINGRAHAP2_LOCUS3333 [Linum grandiflorum]
MKIETKMKQGKEIEIETEIEKLKYVLEHLKEAKRDKMEFSGQTDGEIHREMMSEILMNIETKMKQGKEVEIETEIEKLKVLVEMSKELKVDLKFQSQSYEAIQKELMRYQELSEKGSTSVAETTDDDGKPVKN